jgi:hypothetical protein
LPDTAVLRQKIPLGLIDLQAAGAAKEYPRHQSRIIYQWFSSSRA